jgi:hypothetical protein
MATELILCKPKFLPPETHIAAAATAIAENPANRPLAEHLPLLVGDFQVTKAFISVLTTKYWGSGRLRLTVSFLDGADAALRKRIVLHMNAWGKTANVQFTQTAGTGDVRIARIADGYWSYMGTDIRHIPASQPTMNLEAFTMNTPESEFHRVVRHETGHTLGCPHEHVRRELVNKIDPAKAYAYFLRTQGWNQAMVNAQVLTPIEETSLLGTAHADARSIMCYQIPGEITRDGKQIVGGPDIDASDYNFMGRMYPKPGVTHTIKRTTTSKTARPRAKKVAKRAKRRTAARV